MGRAIEILFEPKRGFASSTPTYRFYSDGTLKTLNISFKVSKSLSGSDGNNASVSIYNLSRDTISALSEKFTDYYCSILVGTEESRELLFGGGIKRVWYSKENLDKKVEITLYKAELDRYYLAWLSLSATEYGRLVFVDSLRKNSREVQVKNYKNLETMINLIAQCYKECQYPNLKISGLRGPKWKNYYIRREKVPKSLSFVNQNFSQILTKVCSEYGLTWSIDNDEFYYVPDDYFDEFKKKETQKPKNIIKVGRDVIMSSQIVLSEGFGTFVQGASIEAIMNPAVVPGTIIEMDSSFYSQFNQQYMVHDVEFEGTAKGNNWKMSLECKRMF